MLNCSVDFLSKRCAAEDTVAVRTRCSVWERRVLYGVFVENARAASHDFDRNRFIIFSIIFYEEFFLLLSPSYRAPPTEHSLRPCDLH